VTAGRARLTYAAVTAGVIVTGLWINQRAPGLPPAVRDVLGDALWAMMVVWALGALAPSASLRMRALAALGIACTVEVSQLVHAPVLDWARQTTLGRLALGTGFDPRDFVAYSGGVVAAFLAETAVSRRERGRG
jgi:hypothetical protein